MIVRNADAQDSVLIEKYIGRTGETSLYHGYRWGSVIEDCFSHKCHYLMCEGESGEVHEILPLVHMKSRMFGSFLVSMPYFNYGGVCADTEEHRSLLIEEAIRIVKAAGASHIELRQHFDTEHIFLMSSGNAALSLILSGLHSMTFLREIIEKSNINTKNITKYEKQLY